MTTSFKPALPSQAPSATRISAFYRVGAAAAFALAAYMMWDALHYQKYWQSPVGGYASLALAITSMTLAVYTELSKPVAYNLDELPKHDWPYAEIIYVTRTSHDVLGSGPQAKAIALDSPEDHYAWRNLRPTVLVFALGSSVFSVVALLLTVGISG